MRTEEGPRGLQKGCADLRKARTDLLLVCVPTRTRTSGDLVRAVYGPHVCVVWAAAREDFRRRVRTVEGSQAVLLVDPCGLESRPTGT